MDTKVLKLNTDIELIENLEFAATSLNPYFQWAKIVVTDDQPNANRKRIPLEEYDNLIKTGIFSPVKMDYGSIAGHDEAKGKPIGVISQLSKETNKVIALAALWKYERESDIAMLKDMYTKGTPPQVSWEIAYSDSKVNEDGIEDLIGTSLFGLVVVENPAYTGRTPFVAMSENTNQEVTSVEELEALKAKIKELEEALSAKTQELEDTQRELSELKTYKESVEKEEADNKRFAEIVKRFKDSGINKDDTYFAEKRESLLELSESQLDFMIQELVAFSQKLAESEVEKKNKGPQVPPLTNLDNIDLSDPKAIGRMLRESKSK